MSAELGRKMEKELFQVMYVGDDARLAGKTALAKPSHDNDLFVQFDEIGLTIDGRVLSHSWTCFKRKEFVKLEKEVKQ